ncbi:hypothetical protein [Nonomuraea zeae]|uniref:hypothetical protein n=1 Tax=Nonomuraea zeae TaxID=1642303 RepID=UPI001478EBD6|nr:hypothetical protein [Nonomuraea zeae]
MLKKLSLSLTAGALAAATLLLAAGPAAAGNEYWPKGSGVAPMGEEYWPRGGG